MKLDSHFWKWFKRINNFLSIVYACFNDFEIGYTLIIAVQMQNSIGSNHFYHFDESGNPVFVRLMDLVFYGDDTF